MLESSAITPREGAAAIHGDRPPRQKKRAETAPASDSQNATAEAGPQESPLEAAPLPDASSGGEAAAPEVSPDRGASPGGEIELKLLVDADRLAGFNTAPVIVANARNKGSRKRLRSAYFDTPERILRRDGLSLRVRQTGARFVQTVKADFPDDPLR